MDGLFLSLKLGTGSFCILLLTGCGIQDSMNRTLSQTQKMQSGMETSIALQQELAARTKLAFHQQTLSLSLSGLFNPDNTQDLKPPTKMVPYGKSFAEEATPDEIASMAALYIGDARNREGGILTIHERQVDLTGVGIVGGYTARDKFDEILRTQIENHGKYEDYIYTYILTRYDFIRDFLFLPLFQKSQYPNKTSVLSARDYYRDLKQIAQLPYSARIRIEIPAIFYTEVLNTAEAGNLAQQAVDTFTSKLSSSVLQDPEVVAALNELRN